MRKVPAIVILVLLTAAAGGFYLYKTNPLFHFGFLFAKSAIAPTKCNKYDIDLEMPELMKTSIVRFEQPTNVGSEMSDAQPGCPGILGEAHGYITSRFISASSTILDEHEFIVLKHAFIDCHQPFDTDCFEDVPGDSYLLQDIKTGTKYWVPQPYLGFESKNYKEIMAGYYDKSNPSQRLGDVVVRRWGCSDKGCAIVEN
jgi:hypothetical protein